MGLYHEQLYKMGLFSFSEKNEKTPEQLLGTLQNGFEYAQVGVGFTKWFSYFSKNNEQIYKMVCSLF